MLYVNISWIQKMEHLLQSYFKLNWNYYLFLLKNISKQQPEEAEHEFFFLDRHIFYTIRSFGSGNLRF